jgi:hypothetical protein
MASESDEVTCGNGDAEESLAGEDLVTPSTDEEIERDSAPPPPGLEEPSRVEEGAAPRLRRLYSFRFTVSFPRPAGSPVPIQSAATNRAVYAAFRELRRCFNCSFPVNGAPRAYPQPGQLLPLRICNLGPDIVCKNAPVKFYPEERLSGWYFVAQRGHFDGKGSRVHFRLWENRDRFLQLSVVADVANPTIPDSINKAAAHVTWSRFASRLGNNMYRHQSCRPTCR